MINKCRRSSNANCFDVAIVGGGISGLYCARELASRGLKNIVLLERLGRFGGRIETGDLRGFVKDTFGKRPFLKAEFGPMRFELDIQPRFAKLCDQLGIEFQPFPPPAGARSPVSYSLPPDECSSDGMTPLDALELLKLGVYRMFNKTTLTEGSQITLVRDDQNDGWLRRLKDDAAPPYGFEHLRMTARSVRSRSPLWQMGFWNALAEVLSPLAIKKIKDEGTFYHLIPLNPNAIEWAIFWLRLFQLGDKPLSTIPRGVETVVARLQAELETKWDNKISLYLNRQVTAITVCKTDNSIIEVNVRDLSKKNNHKVLRAKHVILALPKKPLEDLCLQLPPSIGGYIKQVTGFSLLKAFLCGRVPSWWPQDGTPTPQDRAWLLPTREVHYFRDCASGNAMTLLYMDCPAAQYWGHYLQAADAHDAAEYGGNAMLKAELVRYVFGDQREIAASSIPKNAPLRERRVDAAEPASVALLKLVEQLEQLEDGLGEVSEHLGESMLDAYRSLHTDARTLLRSPEESAVEFFDNVSDYAIRDWSREPFGGGCHAWVPMARSWEARAHLRAFPLDGSAVHNLHVCGEAYSDYQGFIEGALRSAADVVSAICGERPQHSGPV